MTMNRREQLMKRLTSLKKPHAESLGGFHGAAEWQVATKEGTAVVSVQDGSDGPEEVEMDADTCKYVSALLREGPDAVLSFRDGEPEMDDDSDEDGPPDIPEDELLDAVALIQSGCKPGKWYKLVIDQEISLENLLSDGADRYVVFSKRERELNDRWVEDLVMAAGDHFDKWEDKPDEELERWAKRLHLLPASKVRSSDSR